MKIKSFGSLLALLFLFFAAACWAQTNTAPPGTPPAETASQAINALLLIMIPVLTPMLVRLSKWLLPKTPTWFLPILAPSLVSLANWLSMVAGGPSVNPILAVVLGAAGTGFREIKDQVQGRIKEGPPQAIPLIFLCGALLFGGTGCANFWHPEKIAVAPVAEGQDAVIVNAERIQVTSLFAYEKMINWELNNRAVLPVSVSKVVDKARAEFLPNWKESRKALLEYKKMTTGVPLDAINQLSAALSVAQSSFLHLASDQGADLNGVLAALNSFATSVQVLKNK